jgi:hypothetical protein
LAVGSWQLAVGSWQLAVGSWQLAQLLINKDKQPIYILVLSGKHY